MKFRPYGKEYLPGEETAEKTLREPVWVHMRPRFFRNVQEGIAIQWSLHSGHSSMQNFQSAWGWVFRSTDITRGFHSTQLPHSASRSLTIPPIFGSERKGIPDDDSKAAVAKGNSLHICFMHVCACVHYLRMFKIVYICEEFKMTTWLTQLSQKTTNVCVYTQMWVLLSFYVSSHFLEAILLKILCSD